MKYNPFQPNKIVTPGMFVGRVDELRKIEQCLFQAKRNNSQHFLIHGERGIGKSSLLVYVDSVANGRIKTFDGSILRFVTASVDLGGCVTQVDILRAIGRGIKQAISDHQAVKEGAKAFWDWISKWEVLGVRYHRENPDIDPQDITDELVSQIGKFCSHVSGYVDGLVILIDEADRPSVDAGLGELLKSFTERLTKRGCDNVVIGLAGLPILLGRLRDSHESAPRLFETLLLEPLEPEERKTVVKLGLDKAEVENKARTNATPDAMDMLVELSEGYPHFVQQFAFSAFACDEDNVIDVADVKEGAYQENGALAQLGRKYFDELYYQKIASDDYRSVLKAMAEHGDDWVTRKQIISETKLKDATVNNALNALKSRNIILLDDGRQGHYRLPTKSFAAWINAIKSVSGNSADDPELF